MSVQDNLTKFDDIDIDAVNGGETKVNKMNEEKTTQVANGEIISESSLVAIVTLEEVNSTVKIMHLKDLKELTLCTYNDYDHNLESYNHLSISFAIEIPEMNAGKAACKEALEFFEKCRKPSSISENISNFFWKVNYDDYTDEEIHVELMMALTHLALAVLTIFGEQTFMALIKAGLRIRTGYNGYRFCEDALKNRKQWNTKVSRDEFEAGVSFGFGAINLLMSHLPSKVLKLISILGFPCDRQKGESLLRKSFDLKHTWHRNFPCIFFVIVYYLYFEPIFGMTEGDYNFAAEAVEDLYAKEPNGCFTLLFKGRLNEMRGNPESALDCYNKSVASQSKWIHLNNVCYWDMIWCHAIQLQWGKAAEYADILVKQCKWSPATNCYQKGVFMHLLSREKKISEEEVFEIMKKVDGLRIRFGGKTLPPEKFAATKSEKFLREDGKIPLPAIELFHVWSIFSITGGSPKYLEPILRLIEEELQVYMSEKESDEGIDNYALCLLLKGVCLRHLHQYEEAVKCFREIINGEDRILCDKYILPNAYCELGLTLVRLNRSEEAKLCLETAKNNYTGYLMETMIHLRAHNGLRFIKQSNKNEQQVGKRGLRKALTFF
ncbi:tetratricopeptide repeat protein 39B-like protein [Dinothrombium tinctorium]|uniref:Tetratricopeptide repeat protein 39B-like protein n=1 Tax=Dinothrombium tinctorium TaxID=1965070 RepID=A0A3S3PAD3_9ACAR|nr:tetratricopeptide repeat protein 39B-like protein [Dinothrombium tinctorium]